MLCVSLSALSFENCRSILPRLEMAEIRLDSVVYSEEELSVLFASATPLIATCRPGAFTEEESLFVLKTAIMSGADYVDVEIEAPEYYINDIVDLAKEKGCKVIVSYHNYEVTPSTRDLQKIIKKCQSLQADIVKIATMVHSNKDNAILLALYNDNENLVALGMGEKGRISRVSALYLGAPFTFAALNKDAATAPGQIDMNTMKEIIGLIHNEI